MLGPLGKGPSDGRSRDKLTEAKRRISNEEKKTNYKRKASPTIQVHPKSLSHNMRDSNITPSCVGCGIGNMTI